MGNTWMKLLLQMKCPPCHKQQIMIRWIQFSLILKGICLDILWLIIVLYFISINLNVNCYIFIDMINSLRQNENKVGGHDLFSNDSLTMGATEDTNTESNGYYKYSITVTALRQNPEYMIYYIYWTRLVVMGILPTILLIYFNYKVRHISYL